MLLNLVAKADAILTTIEVQLEPGGLMAGPNEGWLEGFVYEKPGGRPKWQRSYSCSTVKRRAANGASQRDKGGYVLGPVIKLERANYGRESLIEELATIDFEGWAGAPAEIDLEISNERGEVFALHLNWAHKLLSWTKKPFFSLSTAKHPANPLKKSLGEWYNALENKGATPLATRLKEQFKLIRQVRGINGRYLGLGDRQLHVWAPTDKIEAVNDALRKLVLVPATDGVSSGGGNTSAVFERAVPHEVRELRSDALIVAAEPPTDQLKAFNHLRGQTQLDKDEPNTNSEAAGAGLAEFEVFVWDSSSDLYKNEGKLGFAKRHRRGYGLGSPHCLNISYDGLATATVDGIDYSSSVVPKLY